MNRRRWNWFCIHASLPDTMASKYYVRGEERAARVRDLFAVVASRYDLINDLQSFALHRVWKRRLVQLAQPRAGQLLLDLCSGTGDIAFRLERAGARVVGLDFSAAMLRVAQGRAGQRSRVQWVRADALHLPFDSESFHALTISYGLRNLASLENAVGEMLRVLKPGGRLLALDFGKPANPLLRSVYFAYLRRLVPIFGKVFCGECDTYSYILDSLRQYPAQNGVAALMAEMNCENIRIINLLGGMMSINYGEKAG